MRPFVFGLALAAATAASAQQDFSKVQIQVTRVAGNVWMLKGSGGNIAVTAGDDGVAMVDTQFAPLAEKIHAAIAGISKQPVKFVINTHWHFDHVGGNLAFSETATILAHNNARARMERGDTNAFGVKQDPAPPKALPVVSFDQGLSLWWNGEEIRAIHTVPGHTDGDTVVWFTKSNVVHMGDDYFTTGFPYVDLKSGGSVVGVVHAIDSILGQIPQDAKIIPGHGQVTDVAALRKYRSALDEMISIVQKGLAQGKTVEQLQKANVLAAWADWGVPNKFVSANDFIATIAQDLHTRAAKK